MVCMACEDGNSTPCITVHKRSNFDCNGSLLHYIWVPLEAAQWTNRLPGRFDVRLLLESVEELAHSSNPSPTQLRAQSDPLADVGWDDVPSDSEDTFFLSPEEVVEYHHDKRRRMLEKGRQDRLRALAEEDESQADPTEISWRSDEEVCNSSRCSA